MCCQYKPLMYEGAVTTNSSFGEGCSIGQWSTVRNSSFANNVNIQRFNAVDSCSIGKYTYTGRYTTLLHCDIGAFSSISWGVSIGGANHDFTKMTTHDFLYNPQKGFLPEDYSPENHFKEPCCIGNDVWIGANVSIMRDVIVGDGAVIGAGSVVTKSVEPYSIVVGSPARIIKRRFDDSLIERLLKLQWWNFSDEIIQENFDLFDASPQLVIDQLEKIKSSFQL